MFRRRSASSQHLTVGAIICGLNSRKTSWYLIHTFRGSRFFCENDLQTGLGQNRTKAFEWVTTIGDLACVNWLSLQGVRMGGFGGADWAVLEVPF